MARLGNQHAYHGLKRRGQGWVSHIVPDKLQLILQKRRADSEHPHVVGNHSEHLLDFRIEFRELSFSLFRWGCLNKRHDDFSWLLWLQRASARFYCFKRYMSCRYMSRHKTVPPWAGLSRPHVPLSLCPTGRFGVKSGALLMRP